MLCAVPGTHFLSLLSVLHTLILEQSLNVKPWQRRHFLRLSKVHKALDVANDLSDSAEVDGIRETFMQQPFVLVLV